MKKTRTLKFFRRLMSAAITMALFAALESPAQAADANWQTFQFHPDQQYTIYCGAVLLCDIELQPGERVRAGLGSLVQMWDNQLIYEGEGIETPHLVLKPSRQDLHENVLITTNRRIYRLYLISTNSANPTYTRFSFSDEDRARAQHEQRMRDIAREQEARRYHFVRATPAPITTIDQACASMRQPGWRMDRTPVEFYPRQVCESTDHTFIALPLSKTQPTDLPVPFVVTNDGDRPINYRYDSNNRIFVIDGTASEYVLIIASGRHSSRLRVQRIEPQHARK